MLDARTTTIHTPTSPAPDYRQQLDEVAADGARRLGCLLGRLTAPSASNHGRVVAFAAVNRGAGSTEAVREVGEALKVLAHRKVLTTTIDHLQSDIAENGDCIFESPETSLERAFDSVTSAKSKFDRMLANLHRARHSYDVILMDCPPLEDSLDTRRAAVEADGVVLIVAAGQTRTPDVVRMARELSETGATVLGAVLTGREYPVPSWLYRIFGRP